MFARIITSICLPMFFVASLGIAADFNDVRNYIKAAPKENFYVDNCVKPAVAGTKKIACQLGKYPEFGLIVCSQPTVIAGTTQMPCQEFLKSELLNLQLLDRKGIVVTEFNSDLQSNVDGAIVADMPCMETGKNECAGFVQHWLDGHFKFDDVFSNITLATCQTEGIVKKIINKNLYGGKGEHIFYERLRQMLSGFDERQKRILAYNFLAISRFNMEKVFIEDLQGFLDQADEGAFFAVNDPNAIRKLDDNTLDKETLRKMIICQQNITKALGELIQDGPLVK